MDRNKWMVSYNKHMKQGMWKSFQYYSSAHLIEDNITLRPALHVDQTIICIALHRDHSKNIVYSTHKIINHN